MNPVAAALCIADPEWSERHGRLAMKPAPHVLAAGRGTWVAIDPKPWLGDPAFDLAQLLVNWSRVDRGSRDEAAATTVRRAERLAASFSLDVGRVLRWAVVKAIGWNAGLTTRSCSTRLHASRRRKP